MIDNPRRVDFSQREGRTRLDADVRIHLPPLPQLSRGPRGAAFGQRGHAALALLTGKILRADRAGLGILEFVEMIHGAGLRLRGGDREDQYAEG